MSPEPQNRRQNDALLLLVQTIHHDVTAMNAKLTSHIETEPEEWANTLQGLLDRAFPYGDPEGHRTAHEAQMQAVLDRAEFWKTMRTEVSKWGILGVLGWLAYHAWAAFLQGPK